METPSSDAVALNTLLPGEKGRVLGTRSLSPAVFRLIELGLTPGTQVEMVRRAPLGGPLQIRVRRARLCLRRPDAACFFIERLS